MVKLLKESDRESWSSIPRIYTVLRLIGRLVDIDMFLNEGYNDLWLPFSIAQLPRQMSAPNRKQFLECQDKVQ